VVPTKKARALAAEALQARADSRAGDIAPIIKDLQAARRRVTEHHCQGIE
jgi:hypothetical protein